MCASRRASTSPLRLERGPAAPAREAAQAPGRATGSSRTASSRVPIPTSALIMRIERIAHRPQHHHPRADMRELGLGLQGGQAPRRLRRARATAPSRRASTSSPSSTTCSSSRRSAAAARDRACDRTRAGRAVRAQPVHDRIRSRSPARSRRSTPESGGRAFLGLAAGAWLDRLGLDPPPVADGDPRDVGRSSGCCSPATESGFDGELFHLAPGNRLAFTTRCGPSVPLLVGTWSPRLTSLRGRGGRRAEARWLRQPGDGRP